MPRSSSRDASCAVRARFASGFGRTRVLELEERELLREQLESDGLLARLAPPREASAGGDA